MGFISAVTSRFDIDSRFPFFIPDRMFNLFGVVLLTGIAATTQLSLHNKTEEEKALKIANA